MTSRSIIIVKITATIQKGKKFHMHVTYYIYVLINSHYFAFVYFLKSFSALIQIYFILFPFNFRIIIIFIIYVIVTNTFKAVVSNPTKHVSNTFGSQMVQLLSKPILNKYYAEVRLINSRRGDNLISDLFFELDKWPKYMIEIFVKPIVEYSYSDR